MEYKIGVCEWCVPIQGPFAVTLAGKAGFEGIQIGDLGGVAAGFPLNCKSVQEGYLQAAADTGVVLQAIHPCALQRQGTMLCPPGTSGWDEAQRSIAMLVDACVAMHVPELMLSSFFSTYVRNEYEFDIFAQHMARACEMAEEQGITVSYESALPVERIREMIRRTGGKLKVCYDVRNPLELGWCPPETEIPALGTACISHFHLKDAPRRDIKNWCLIGDGAADIPRMAEVIRATGYSGWLVSENDYGFLAAEAGCDFLKLMVEDVRRIKKYFERAFN